MRAALLFVIYFAAAAAMFVPAPVLYDSDSYYHLAVSRLYATDGIFTPVPWATKSILGDGGDKEFLFHLLLAPFTYAGENGGRIALAAINAGIAVLIATLAMRSLGWAGALVPLWLWVAAPPFFGRAARLRPELFALLLILAALVPMRRRALQLGVLAFLFTLSYTAWHVFLTLVIVWAFAARQPRAAAAGAAGTLLGLVLRPFPLQTMKIWWVQNVEYFLRKSALDVGNEITAPDRWYLLASIAFLIGLGALFFTARERDARGAADTLIAAALFVVLFAFMSRMAIYAYPLLLLSVLAVTRGQTARRVSVILAVTALLALPMAARSTAVRALRHGGEPEPAWRAASQMIPTGARVAASWEHSEHFAWFAPQARYLNVLDPVFMALPFPAEHHILTNVLAGREPDIPSALLRLETDHLLVVRSQSSQALQARLARDPRLRVTSDGEHIVARVVPEQMSALRFMRVQKGRCERFTQTIDAHDAPLDAELTPYGPTTLFIDGKPRGASRGVTGAILGRGFRFQIAPSKQPQRVDIETCRAPDGIGGTYFTLRPSA